MRFDEGGHQLDAPRILSNLDDHPSRSQKCFLSQERAVFADDYPRNAVEQDGPVAHRAGRERRVEDRRPIHVRALTAGLFERVHLAVQHDAATLNPPIVAAPENMPLMDEHRTDGDTALAEALLRF